MTLLEKNIANRILIIDSCRELLQILTIDTISKTRQINLPGEANKSLTIDALKQSRDKINLTQQRIQKSYVAV